jgi:leucyl-tRNA---protein transferase
VSTEPPQFSHYPNVPPPGRSLLHTLPPHPCPYLPGRASTLRAFAAREIDSAVYFKYVDAGFRRSGQMIYQPVCDGCRECVQIRVPIETFRPSKSKRRTSRRNADLRITVAEPVPTQEKFDLYSRYCAVWHRRGEPETVDAFMSFLYSSPVPSLEWEYRLGDCLVAVGLCDAFHGRALSSVYFYFDPQFAERSLGTFGALHEIETARSLGMSHYYLGYWIRNCSAMNYKANFRPAEVLGLDGVWRPHADHVGAEAAQQKDSRL